MTATNDAPAPAPSGSGVREAKPCPFCGGPAKMIECMAMWEPGGYPPNGRRIACEAMDCYGVGKPFYGDGMEEAAIAWWNRRASLASDASPRGEAITARYTNWRGETAERTFIPHRVFFGSNEWHPEPQVLIEATDCEKGALRTFAAAGFAHPAPATVEMRGAHGRGKLIEKALTRFLPLVCSATGSEDVSVPADDFAVILGLLKATLPNQASAIEAAYERAIQDAERSFRRNRDRSWVLTCLRERIATEIAALAPATELDSGTTDGQK